MRIRKLSGDTNPTIEGPPPTPQTPPPPLPRPSKRIVAPSVGPALQAPPPPLPRPGSKHTNPPEGPPMPDPFDGRLPPPPVPPRPASTLPSPTANERAEIPQEAPGLEEDSAVEAVSLSGSCSIRRRHGALVLVNNQQDQEHERAQLEQVESYLREIYGALPWSDPTQLLHHHLDQYQHQQHYEQQQQQLQYQQQFYPQAYNYYHPTPLQYTPMPLGSYHPYHYNNPNQWHPSQLMAPLELPVAPLHHSPPVLPAPSSAPPSQRAVVAHTQATVLVVTNPPILQPAQQLVVKAPLPAKQPKLQPQVAPHPRPQLQVAKLEFATPISTRPWQEADGYHSFSHIECCLSDLVRSLGRSRKFKRAELPAAKPDIALDAQRYEPVGMCGNLGLQPQRARVNVNQ